MRIKEQTAGKWGTVALRLLFSTIRLRLEDSAGFLKEPPKEPVIITFWHNRILAITLAFLRHYPHGRQGVVVLTSPSRDGRILGEVARGLGMQAIYGSNNKRPAQAVLSSAQMLRKGFDMAITPDGPRGPKYHLNPGVIYLAQKQNICILPVHARFSSALTLKSWDGFRIPLPFSRIDVRIGAYERIPTDLTEEEFEKKRAHIENILRNETD